MKISDNPIARQSSAISKMAENWPIITTLLGGTKAIRAAGTTYLPKFTKEEEDSYKRRLSVSTLFPAFSKTVEVLASKPFSKILKSSEDTPERMLEWQQDIDLKGKNLHSFSYQILKESLGYGISYVLVEYPKADGIRTAADEKASGVRPYLVHYSPWNVLGWRFDRINGVEKLVQLRLKESINEPDGDYGEKEVEQIRVLTSGAWETYRKNDKDEWFLFDEGTTSLDYIPFVAFYGKQTGLFTSEPPLLELAYQNIEHYQSKSDQQNILHVARVPILTVIGARENDDISVGAANAISLPVDASMEYVEHSGAAISAGRQDLLDIEERMRQIGAELLMIQPGTVTATQITSENDGNKSALQRIAENFDDAMNLCLQYMADWVGEETGGTVKTYKDFGVTSLSDATAQLLADINMSGKLSNQTLISELKRRNIVSPDVDFEEEQERIQQDGLRQPDHRPTHGA